jgi:hypothetical protein
MPLAVVLLAGERLHVAEGDQAEISRKIEWAGRRQKKMAALPGDQIARTYAA